MNGNIDISTVPFYSDESLLQEDSSLSADLSSSLHLGDATRQASGSIRSANFQGHVFATSNPVPTNQRYCHQTDSCSLVSLTRQNILSLPPLLFFFVRLPICTTFLLQRRSIISHLLSRRFSFQCSQLWRLQPSKLSSAKSPSSSWTANSSAEIQSGNFWSNASDGEPSQWATCVA